MIWFEFVSNIRHQANVLISDHSENYFILNISSLYNKVKYIPD